MSKQSREDYYIAVVRRYRNSDKKTKSQVLDEFCEVCGYNRKYAIRKLNTRKRNNKRKRLGRPKHYKDPILFDVLFYLWGKQNLPCSRRLKAAMPLWLPFYEDRPLSDNIKNQLLAMSPATIDRLMIKMRKKIGKLGLATTKPGSILKSHIPVKTNQWDETHPGYLESDTVAHCGTSVAGSFLYTVNTVDIATGWTEQRAVWGKGYQGMHKALISIENDLPFPILGFDSDNGTEFLNWHLYRHFTNRKAPVQFTRSRPYKKNDNAHIEEKNWSIIRQYLGYNRFEHVELVEELNNIYTSEWRLFMNFFRPSSKLQKKVRINGKVKKVYDNPKTPYQRLLESDKISYAEKEKLKSQFAKLNPFKLQSSMVTKIKQFINKTTSIFEETKST
ncbi:MAG: integrase, partial [Candidatus Marinimicrobia bacterium]|nr:integrase [Candidatus Neomarinimicrobiota bacterium]